MPSIRIAVQQGLLATGAVVMTMAAATQWAAAMLGHQAALGAPWMDLLGFKFYAPWKLFRWWLAFDAQAPTVFARAGTVAALGGVAGGLVAFGEPPGGRTVGYSPPPTAGPAGRTIPMSPGRACTTAVA